jgi:hypothetical protein
LWWGFCFFSFVLAGDNSFGMKIDAPMVTFADLTAQQTANEQKMQSIKAKRAQIKAFKGLPPVCFALQDSLMIPLHPPSASTSSLFRTKRSS